MPSPYTWAWVLVLAIWATPVTASTESPFQAGLAALDRGDVAQALALWRSAAQSGHAAAAYNLGVLHEQGTGTPRNLEEAGRWYLAAAQAGDLDAHLAVARLYETGQGMPRSITTARFWLQRLVNVEPVDAYIQALIQQAEQQLRVLPPDELQEFKFEGGRFLFKEAVLPRCVIALQGRITRDARSEFHRVVARAREVGCVDPWIALESPGGSLQDGIALGRAVHQEGYSTIVAGSCASACALIFMGGRQRELLGSRARIGLHQASSSNPTYANSRKTCYTSPQDDASKSKRRYLREVLSEQGEAIFQRAMKTSCHSIDWVRGETALEMGMATRVD